MQGLEEQVSKYLNFINSGMSFLHGQHVIGARLFLLSVKIQFFF